MSSIPISQTSVEEPDRSYPALPKPPANLLKDEESRLWWKNMEKWWEDAVRALRN